MIEAASLQLTIFESTKKACLAQTNFVPRSKSLGEPTPPNASFVHDKALIISERIRSLVPFESSGSFYIRFRLLGGLFLSVLKVPTMSVPDSTVKKTMPGMVTRSQATGVILDRAKGQSNETDSDPSEGANLLAAALVQVDEGGDPFKAAKYSMSEDIPTSDDETTTLSRESTGKASKTSYNYESADEEEAPKTHKYVFLGQEHCRCFMQRITCGSTGDHYKGVCGYSIPECPHKTHEAARTKGKVATMGYYIGNTSAHGNTLGRRYEFLSEEEFVVLKSQEETELAGYAMGVGGNIVEVITILTLLKSLRSKCGAETARCRRCQRNMSPLYALNRGRPNSPRLLPRCQTKPSFRRPSPICSPRKSAQNSTPKTRRRP